jgi:hypothetical protein
MKRILFAIMALAIVACTKEETPEPTKILNLTIGDFPAYDIATRAGESVGKTAWENGDELMIEYYDNYDDVMSGEGNPSRHIASYNDGSWTLDTPIELAAGAEATDCIIAVYRPGFEWSDDGTVTVGGNRPTESQLLQSETLVVYNSIEGENHTLTFSYIKEDEIVKSSIMIRNNRIRIIGTPNATITIAAYECLYSKIDYMRSQFLEGTEDITLDESGNAFIYLRWPENSEGPKLYITPAGGEEITIKLPYGEDDGIDAPYPYFEFINEMYLCIHAYAYSIDLRSVM